MVKIFLKDIIYIEALGNYVRVVNKNKPVVSNISLNYLEEKLPQRHFFRCHRSFIVSADKITSFSKNHIDLNDKKVPIGRFYRNKTISGLKNDSFNYEL